jgi:hypothetical protein
MKSSSAYITESILSEPIDTPFLFVYIFIQKLNLSSQKKVKLWLELM